MILPIVVVVLPVFLVIGAGYAATRSGIFSAAAVDGLMVFTRASPSPACSSGRWPTSTSAPSSTRGCFSPSTPAR